jgi:SAM-dependent methyltransferase
MVGDVDAALARSDLELDALSLPAQAAARRSIWELASACTPFLWRGADFRVAIDSYKPLLQELASRAGSLPIRTVNADLLDFRLHAKTADVITCMGDTLTHLPSQASVATLFREVAASLRPGGVFAATFRDYATAPLRGDSRFILVRGDGERVLTCFLEYADTTVTVHDLLHQRENGAWQLRASSYPKLRLAPQWVVEQLSSLGLSVQRDATPGGMIRIRAAPHDRWRSEAREPASTPAEFLR